MIICVVLAPAAIIVKSIPFSTRPITPSLAASATWIDSETSACMAGAVPRMAVTSASRPSRFRNPIPDATHKGAYPKTLEEAATGNLICSSARANTGKRNTKDVTSPNRLNFIVSSFSHDRLHRNHKRRKGPGRGDSTTASQNVGIQLRRRQHLSTGTTSSLVFFASAIIDSRDTELIFRLPNPSKCRLPSVRSLESFRYFLAACLILSAN